MHDVGDERTGHPRLDIAFLAVLEQRPCDLDAGGGVRDVVEQDLLGLGIGQRGEAPNGTSEDALSEVDDGRGSREVGSGHATEASEERSCRSDR